MSVAVLGLIGALVWSRFRQEAVYTKTIAELETTIQAERRRINELAPVAVAPSPAGPDETAAIALPDDIIAAMRAGDDASA